MTSRTRHIAVIAAILLFVIPAAARREQSWAIALQAAIGGMAHWRIRRQAAAG